MNNTSDPMATERPTAQRYPRMAKARIEKTIAQPVVMPNIQRMVYCGMGFCGSGMSDIYTLSNNYHRSPPRSILAPKYFRRPQLFYPKIKNA
jgi:hypothetical protein